MRFKSAGSKAPTKGLVELETDMLAKMFGEPGGHRAHNPEIRGYRVVYRENETNHCPGCGRSHWYVGRVSAECGFCGTALPLVEASQRALPRWTQPQRRESLQRDAA